MSAVCRVNELGLVRDLPAPGLPAAKSLRPAGLPQDRREPVRNGADKVPLPTAEMAGTCNEKDTLFEAAQLDTEPALYLAAHVGANHTGGKFTLI
jgi:hypothetical protein